MGNDGYTIEQLEEISNLYASEIKEKRLKIVEIDKKFKNNNAKIIHDAIYNVSGIVAIIGVVLLSDKSIQDFGETYVTSLIQEMNNFLVPLIDKVDPLDLMSATYMQLIGVLEEIINKFGILGVGLAGKAISFITGTIKKGIKSKQLKDEKESLEQKIKDFENVVNGKTDKHI